MLTSYSVVDGKRRYLHNMHGEARLWTVKHLEDMQDALQPYHWITLYVGLQAFIQVTVCGCILHSKAYCLTMPQVALQQILT